MSPERGYLCVSLGCYCHDQNDVTLLVHGMGPANTLEGAGFVSKIAPGE